MLPAQERQRRPGPWIWLTGHPVPKPRAEAAREATWIRTSYPDVGAAGRGDPPGVAAQQDMVQLAFIATCLLNIWRRSGQC